MMSAVSIIIGLGIIAFLIYSIVNRAKGRNSKVTPIPRKRLKLSSKQACTYCKRKVDQLSFYSDRQGKVIGVCNVCKPQAERQALLRL
jgi:putative hemolysin